MNNEKNKQATSSSLREQFEAYYRETRGASTHHFRKLHSGRYYCDVIEEDWELWQAAVAASGRDELLQALREIELEYLNDSRHGALASKMASIANNAIKKARGEA